MPHFGIMVSFMCSLDSLNLFCEMHLYFLDSMGFVVSELLIMHYLHNHS